MRTEYAKQSSIFAVASNKYLSIDAHLAIAKQYHDGFVDLYNRGIFGAEHRLSWVEALNAASERIPLADLSYSIDVQQEYMHDIPVHLGDFKLYSSAMQINLKILHEGDLLNLINDLNKNAAGIFTINECSMEFLSDVLVKRHDAENIAAYCELQWLNVHNSDGTVITL